VPGILLAGLGALIVWVDQKVASDDEARKTWSETAGLLSEIGIRFTPGVKVRSSYFVTARFTFRAGGREYEGRAIAGGNSTRSLTKAASLVALYVPEAARLTRDDFALLRPERVWPVARDVPVRFDARDPSRCEAVLGPALRDPGETPAWLPRLIAVVLLGVGGLTLFLSRHLDEPAPGRERPPGGPPISSAVYSEGQRLRLSEAIHRLQAEVDRLRAGPGLGDVQTHFAEAVDELTRTARDGTLVPADHAAYGYGRWANEIFGDESVCVAASAVGDCFDDMATVRALAGPVRQSRKS